VGVFDDPEVIGKRFVHSGKRGRPPRAPPSAIQEVPIVPPSFLHVTAARDSAIQFEVPRTKRPVGRPRKSDVGALQDANAYTVVRARCKRLARENPVTHMELVEQ
jgi:hypothetical protein